MRAFEIPDFLNERIRREAWAAKNYYIQWCKSNQRFYSRGNKNIKYENVLDLFSQDDWGVYEEPALEEQWYRHEYWSISDPTDLLKKERCSTKKWDVIQVHNKVIPINVDQEIDKPEGL